jgi:hypothetical protein
VRIVVVLGGCRLFYEHEDVSRARSRLTNTGRRTSHGGRGRRRPAHDHARVFALCMNRIGPQVS